MCELLGLDPAVYYFETDKRKNAYRDAAATVMHQRKEAEAERNKARQQARRSG